MSTGNVLSRAITEPIRTGLSWQQTWEGPDRGLIRCWERGREMRDEQPQLAEQAERGELPLLPWRGGIEGQPAMKWKYGARQYLAMWQGLRGEDLNVRLDEETDVTCTRAGVRVRFTDDTSKFTT
jgi:hypothetical protein